MKFVLNRRFVNILTEKLNRKRDHNFPKNNRRRGGRTVITSTNTQTKLYTICETSMDSLSTTYLYLVGRWGYDNG